MEGWEEDESLPEDYRLHSGCLSPRGCNGEKHARLLSPGGHGVEILHRRDIPFSHSFHTSIF